MAVHVYFVCVHVYVLRILVECIFILNVAGDGQDLTDNALLPSTSTSLNLFVCSTCLLDTFQPCLFFCSLHSQAPLFHGLPEPDKSDSKFRDISQRHPGLKREESADKVSLLFPVYHVLFISLEHVRMSGILPSLWSRRCCGSFFCTPIKCHPPYSGPKRPHLYWQRFQITSFSSVGLDFIKLGGCWGSNRISLLFKFQLQWCCQWAWPFNTPLLVLTFFFHIVWLQYGIHWQKLCFRPGVLSAAPYKLDSSHFCDETC